MSLTQCPINIDNIHEEDSLIDGVTFFEGEVQRSDFILKLLLLVLIIIVEVFTVVLSVMSVNQYGFFS